MRPLALLVLALLLVAPTGAAHGVDMPGVFSAKTKDLAVFLNTDTVVVKAQRETLFNVSAFANETDGVRPLDNASIQIDVTGPGSAPVTLNRTPEGKLQARLTYPAPGEYDMLIHVDGELLRTTVHVYPATAVWMESSNLRTNYHYAGKLVRENLYFLDDVTGLVAAPKNGAEGRLFRLVNDTPTDMQNVRLEPGPMGSVVFERLIETPAYYQLTLATEELGIAHASLPEIKFLVKEPLVRASDSAATPGPGALLVALIVAALAIVRRK